MSMTTQLYVMRYGYMLYENNGKDIWEENTESITDIIEVLNLHKLGDSELSRNLVDKALIFYYNKNVSRYRELSDDDKIVFKLRFF